MVLELGYDYSKVEGVSKSGNMSLTFLTQNPLWITTLKGGEGAGSKQPSLVKGLTGLIVIPASEIFTRQYVKTRRPLGNKWGC